MNGFTFCNNKKLFTINLQPSLITNSQKKKKKKEKKNVSGTKPETNFRRIACARACGRQCIWAQAGGVHRASGALPGAAASTRPGYWTRRPAKPIKELKMK